MVKIPRKDITIVQGDWNAKTGTEAFKASPEIAGRFGIDPTYDRSIRLLEYARTHNMVLANTCINS